MTHRLLVTIAPISSDPLKAGASAPTVYLSKADCLADTAAIRPKHLRLGVRTFEGIEAACLSFDRKDVAGHEMASRRPAVTDTPRLAIPTWGQSAARDLGSPGGARLIEE